MSAPSIKKYHDNFESSSGSDFCEEEYLAYQSLKPEGQKRNQKCKQNKGGSNFYSKIKVKNEEKINLSFDYEPGSRVSKSDRAEKNINSKNIRQLEQNVIELSEKCKKLGIYVGDPDTQEEGSKLNDNETDGSEEELTDTSKPIDTITTPYQGDVASSHKKFKKQRVGGGTGNTKCHKKNSKKHQTVVLEKMVQHLEKLLEDHKKKQKNNNVRKSSKK